MTEYIDLSKYQDNLTKEVENRSEDEDERYSRSLEQMRLSIEALVEDTKRRHYEEVEKISYIAKRSAQLREIAAIENRDTVRIEMHPDTLRSTLQIISDMIQADLWRIPVERLRISGIPIMTRNYIPSNVIRIVDAKTNEVVRQIIPELI